MTLHNILRPFVKASKAPATTPTPISTPCPGPIQYLPSNPPVLPRIPHVTSLVPQTQPQTHIGAPDLHSPVRRIWVDDPLFPEAKIGFEGAVELLRFVEKLPLKELSLLCEGIDMDRDTKCEIDSDATGASFYSCRSSDSRIEDGGKMMNSWYTCNSKPSNSDNVDAPHHEDTGKSHASESDETPHKLGRRDHHLISTRSSSSSSLPVFTYTPLPRPLPIYKNDSTGTSSSSSSSLRSLNFTPLPCIDTTPFTSPIQSSSSPFPLRTSSSPFYNPSSFPYERSTSPPTASSVYASTSTPSGVAAENSHRDFYVLPQYSDVESDPSFYRLPQYSDIEDESFYDEPFVRKESFGSRASGEVRRPGRTRAMVGGGEEMAGTSVGRVEDIFGEFEWDGEGEVGEIGRRMESWSEGRWGVVELRDWAEIEEKAELWWGLGRRATV